MLINLASDKEKNEGTNSPLDANSFLAELPVTIPLGVLRWAETLRDFSVVFNAGL